MQKSFPLQAHNIPKTIEETLQIKSTHEVAQANEGKQQFDQLKSKLDTLKKTGSKVQVIVAKSAFPDDALWFYSRQCAACNRRVPASVQKPCDVCK